MFTNRFDKFLLCFDLVKVFLQIALPESDQQKLCFLWFRNPLQGDFSVIGYRNVRLSFGLNCSPSLLMLALYKILILDAENDDELLEIKKKLYHNFYMDNCGFTTNNLDAVNFVYELLPKIFSPYKFDLQQFYTNELNLQSSIDAQSQTETPAVVPLLGLLWDRVADTISTRKMSLNALTKREILRSIASNFDIYTG